MKKMREEILTMIEKNNKLSTKDLADMFGVDESLVISEIAKMEEEKVICGYHTLINWDKTEKELVTALIEVKVTPQRGRGFDEIAERIYNFPQVKSVYLMSGSFDLTVVIEGRTMKEVAMFVSEKLAPLDPVLSTATHFILKKYKDHGTVMEAVTKPERMAILP